MTICKKHIIGIINIIKQFCILHACDKTSKLNPVFKMHPCDTFILFKFKLIVIPFQLYPIFIVKISNTIYRMIFNHIIKKGFLEFIGLSKDRFSILCKQ